LLLAELLDKVVGVLEELFDEPIVVGADEEVVLPAVPLLALADDDSACEDALVPLATVVPDDEPGDDAVDVEFGDADGWPG
jgi:hypothetical protein